MLRTRTLKALVFACCLAGGIAYAQSGEVAAIGGYGFAHDLTLKGPPGTAKAGFSNGLAGGAFLAHEASEHFSGEIRYLFRASDLKLSSGATTATFTARSQIIHLDWLAHFQRRESRTRFFLAFGGGARVVQGTGIESAAQPLSRFAGLTHTLQTLPVADFGAGVKVNLSPHARLRLEVRDYLSTRPDQVIAPAPAVAMKGFLHDVLGLVAIGYTFGGGSLQP